MKLALLLCLATSVVHADDKPALTKPDTSKIEALFDEGTKRYDLGQWDAAIASFRQAYALMPDPSFLYNIAQAYRQKHACRDSSAAYKAFLRNAPDEDRAKVEQFIKELEPCVAREEENARRLVPQRVLPAGPAWPRTLRWSGYATAGVGVALGGAGVLFSLRARRASSDFEEACRNDCEAGTELDKIEQRGKDADRNAKIFYAVGGVAVVTGVVLWAIGRRAEERLTITPTAGGAMASGRWAF